MWTEPWVWWLAFGFFLLVVEMLSGTLFFLCLAPAAFVTAAAAGLSADPTVQGLIFGSAGCVALWGWRRLRRRAQPASHDAASRLNNRTRHLIGREAVLAEPVVNGMGRVNIDDSWWQATCSESLPAGTHVRVTGGREMVVTVERCGRG